MRIVFLNPVGEFGGAERSLVCWLRAVRSAFPAARVTLIVPTEGMLASRARDEGVHVEVLPLPALLAGLGDSALTSSDKSTSRLHLALNLVRATPAAHDYVNRLRRLLRRLEPDFIHSNGLKTHVATWLASGFRRGGRPPVVWHLHDFLARRPLVARVLRVVANNVSAAVAVSDAVAADARALMSRRGPPTRVVHNVVDADLFAPGPGRDYLLDELAGLPPVSPDVLRIVLVATYARWKGQDVFLEAARTLLGRRKHARFYIVGGPIYRTPGSQFARHELVQLATAKGVAAHVGFVEFQNEPAEVYRAADVVVHASTQPEPFGLTIVEAMACGRPVVVSNAGGAAELFEHGHDALGVAPADPAALADAVGRLLDDAELRQRLGKNARESVMRKFNPNALPEQVRSLYHGLL